MSPERGLVGWDIGGAHLKVAWQDQSGQLKGVEVKATPLWQGLDSLEQAVQSLAQRWPLGLCEHRITMTAELVDLFADRRTGVLELAGWLRQRLPEQALYFYAGVEGFVALEKVSDFTEKIASANWLATTGFAATEVSSGVMIDVGSTTSDLLPFQNHCLLNRGFTDHERLTRDEMIYAGIVRTPLMAITRQVPFKGAWLSLANEVFATTSDVYRILGDLPEKADLYPAADGKEKTVSASMRRLARMVGADVSEAEAEEWHRLAAFFADRQIEALSLACQRQFSLGLTDSAVLVGAGVGRFLVKRLANRLGRAYRDMGQLLAQGDDYAELAADCAPAVALLRLKRACHPLCV